MALMAQHVFRGCLERATATYVSHDSGAPASTTATFTNMQCGNGDWVVAAVCCGLSASNAAQASVALGSNTLALKASQISNNSQTHVGIYVGPNPAKGGTANVAITRDSTNIAIGAAVLYEVKGLLMSTTPVDSGSSLADPATDTLDMIFDGFCVGIAYPGSVSASATWTGLNEDVDGSFNGLPTRNFFAASINSAGQISVAPSCTYSSSNSNNRVGVFAAFR